MVEKKLTWKQLVFSGITHIWDVFRGGKFDFPNPIRTIIRW